MVAEDVGALIHAAQAGDQQAMTQLIEDNNGLIWSIARRFFGRGVEPDDLYQLASLGFIKAVRGFDCGFGTAFSTYAVPKIAGEIRRFLRDDGPVKVSRSVKDLGTRLRRLQSELENEYGREITIGELADKAGVPVEEAAMCEQALQATDSLERQLSEDGASLGELLGDSGMEDAIATRLSLRQALSELPDREQQVIALRFGRSMTQTQTARVLGVSQVQVSRIERKAVEHLREAIL
ncbi:sigma-70 family RNA polymerase sigma factor [Intestinibacillus massiliensis]|uniref:sigma-70 family RNA polymerase sigma factor n=1 Tax=Intestinibacillus massiliensis TaxID=1871029 RepID=UPI000B34C1F3|nr:sigma-70 family RNA polymerase sigma factor [Intestinibacillus massiliensis]